MSLSVLLVDDDPERAAIVEPALREAGYDVVTVVDTATEMLAQVRAAPFPTNMCAWNSLPRRLFPPRLPICNAV
jgi:CheY-like chemotaxis protein